jgi:hypothetical protein
MVLSYQGNNLRLVHVDPDAMMPKTTKWKLDYRDRLVLKSSGRSLFINHRGSHYSTGLAKYGNEFRSAIHQILSIIFENLI